MIEEVIVREAHQCSQTISRPASLRIWCHRGRAIQRLYSRSSVNVQVRASRPHRNMGTLQVISYSSRKPPSAIAAEILFKVSAQQSRQRPSISLHNCSMCTFKNVT